jgi:hypothetical protein
VPPPGAKPTIIRIGLFGYAPLSAAEAAEQKDARAITTGSARIAVDFMILLDCYGNFYPAPSLHSGANVCFTQLWPLD